MSLQSTKTIGNSLVIEMDYTKAGGTDANLDETLGTALENYFDVTAAGVVSVDTTKNDDVAAFFDEILAGNNLDTFDAREDLRFFIKSSTKLSDILDDVQALVNSNNTLATGGSFADSLTGSEITKSFFERLQGDETLYGTVFDLNNMSDMSRVPADNYAIALEELRAIGTNSNMGIAELTQATTDVQVESGKLEMINGVVKNAVNYLNTRARALTS